LKNEPGDGGDTTAGRLPSAQHLSRLRWHCRRGMRELDVVLARYLEDVYPQASDAERRAFEALLDLQDPDLMSFLVGRSAPPADPEMAHVLKVFAQYRS